jgi:hypothetical protein
MGEGVIRRDAKKGGTLRNLASQVMSEWKLKETGIFLLEAKRFCPNYVIPSFSTRRYYQDTYLLSKEKFSLPLT